MRYHVCTLDPTAGCLRMQQGNILYRKSHAVALVRAESPQPELMAHSQVREAVEKMSENAGGDPERFHGRAVHVGRGPQADKSDTSRHPNRRRQTSEVLPKEDSLLPASGRNAEARRRRTIKQPLGIPYHSREEGRVMTVLTDDTLDALAGAQRFSILDLESGYWQVEVEEHDQEKTAVTTPFGLYQFRVMLFGLCNALATF
ncbi:RNA-directed DNA polymerase -like protein [Trichinella sp. T6]|nr:RNA-directed DNA polymerase -like protein [Trichinella sp. T6]